ncbi:galactose oxidase [Rhizopus microsporus var. microsporus]|nr:galactose oxidase [Rhizopus microsporus var. microsporus]
MKWEKVQNVKGIPPCKRYGHTATLWNHCIVIFGGCNESQEYCNDVHIFDIETSTWIQPELKDVVPARYLHSAVVYGNKLFIYGGFAKNPECTYVLDELSVLDLTTFMWTRYHGIPPRYNHSATLIGHKMYIYAGKDEQGNTVSDLFVLNLNIPPYTPHLVLSGSRQMVLLKSQHFCEAVCGKLVVFGKYLTDYSKHENNVYGLWMLDLDTLEWHRQDCNSLFDTGGWNYFTIITSTTPDHVRINKLFFLGNTDQHRPQGYDHFRDALVIHSEFLGLYDIPQVQFSLEFSKLLNNPELSDFIIVPSNGQELYVHQVILITRWPHFRNMYTSGMLESQQKRMEIPESYEVVLAFLKYLYNDTLDMNEPCSVVCDLLVLANMYLLHRLKKICCVVLYRHHLTIQNCGLIFEKSIMAEETGLKLLVLDFMFKHYGAVLKSNVLLQMPPFARQEFLEAVPDEAILEVNHRFITTRSIPRSITSTLQLSANRHNIKFNSSTDISTIASTGTIISRNISNHNNSNNSSSSSSSSTATTTNSSSNSNNNSNSNNDSRIFQRESISRLLRSHDSEETLVS